MQPLQELSIRVHFDRFPATIKGAFVLRGIDGDPHQVAISEARLAEVDGEGSSIGLAETLIDVAPGLDVFVPFEHAIGELEPGWYQLECDAAVDGVAATFPGGKRLCVPWPRSAVRRGSVELGSVLAGRGSKVTIDRVECAGDHSEVRFVAEPAEAPALSLRADGRRLPALDQSLDEESGEGTATFYPVLRSHEALRIDLRGGDGLDVTPP